MPSTEDNPPADPSASEVRPTFVGEPVDAASGQEAGGGDSGATRERDRPEENAVDAVEQPAKVMRIGAMTKQLLEEVRQAPLDDASRARLKEIYETSVRELAGGLSPDLASELDRLSLPFESKIPSDAELRVAQAQLVGWLEGLFHGIQATLFAQQMAARSQLDEFRQRGLPPGSPQNPRDEPRPGIYL